MLAPPGGKAGCSHGHFRSRAKIGLTEESCHCNLLYIMLAQTERKETDPSEPPVIFSAGRLPSVFRHSEHAALVVGRGARLACSVALTPDQTSVLLNSYDIKAHLPRCLPCFSTISLTMQKESQKGGNTAADRPAGGPIPHLSVQSPHTGASCPLRQWPNIGNHQFRQGAYSGEGLRPMWYSRPKSAVVAMR